MSNVAVSLVSYKQTKEDIKEIVKDLKTTGRWLTETSKKLKKFNERDILEEPDSAVKQLKELDDKVNAVITILGKAIKRIGQSIEDINVLYKVVLMLLKKCNIWKPLKNKNPLFTERCLIQKFKEKFGSLPFANLKG